ncbi:hypothetical protein O3P69_011659 [Scylla paramamosain]|uniref:Uncharacterized protein n=1 Tax=Scylla paramamosain TaxID=85552 RepID=A0AAW0T7K8_SCYPA
MHSGNLRDPDKESRLTNWLCSVRGGDGRGRLLGFSNNSHHPAMASAALLLLLLFLLVFLLLLSADTVRGGVVVTGGLAQASGRRSVGAKRYWRRSLAPPQARFGSFEAWLNAFMYTFKRDTIFNVAKIGGLILLYYFAPEVFTWVSGTLG